MGQTSEVTEYMIKYLCENSLSSGMVSQKTGIPEEKLRPGYKEPLLADEFLRLCVYLKISPEKIASELKRNESE